MKKYVILFALVALWHCPVDSPARKLLRSGEYLTSVTEIQTPSLDGSFPGTMTMQAGFSGGPFAQNTVYTVNVTRSGFQTDTVYDIYQSEPTDPADPDYDQCVEDINYTVADYQSQTGCNVYTDSVNEKGDVTISIPALGLTLGPHVYHNFSQDFPYNSVNYNLRFGDDYQYTDRADSNTFRVKISEISLLLLDGIGLIQI